MLMLRHRDISHRSDSKHPGKLNAFAENYIENETAIGKNITIIMFFI